MRGFIATFALLAAARTSHAESLFVDPEVGNSTFTAIFDAPLGERITANSSAVKCDVDFDEKAGTASGVCSVPLTSVRVDNEDTKTEHFQQWATNKKTDPAQCALAARFTGVKLIAPLAPEKPVKLAGDVAFTICGRGPEGGGAERLEGTAVLFPPGAYGSSKVIRVRARIDRFNRERYHVGPKHTEGWLARIQSLAKVVAEEGTIDLNVFARAKEK